MGLRDRALEANEFEKTGKEPERKKEERVSPYRDPYDYGHYHDPYDDYDPYFSKKYKKAKVKAYDPGTMQLTIPVYEDHMIYGDPSVPGYTYNKRLQEAEDIAIKYLEEAIQPGYSQKYTVEMWQTESEAEECIYINILLTPKKKKEVIKIKEERPDPFAKFKK